MGEVEPLFLPTPVPTARTIWSFLPGIGYMRTLRSRISESIREFRSSWKLNILGGESGVPMNHHSPSEHPHHHAFVEKSLLILHNRNWV